MCSSSASSHKDEPKTDNTKRRKKSKKRRRNHHGGRKKRRSENRKRSMVKFENKTGKEEVDITLDDRKSEKTRKSTKVGKDKVQDDIGGEIEKDEDAKVVLLSAASEDDAAERKSEAKQAAEEGTDEKDKNNVQEGSENATVSLEDDETTVEPQMCLICYETKSSKEDFIEFPDCHHAYCIACVKQYFEINIREANVDLPCPSPSCSSVASVEMISQLLSEPLCEKYSKFKRNEKLAGNPLCKWCPGCSEGTVDPEKKIKQRESGGGGEGGEGEGEGEGEREGERGVDEYWQCPHCEVEVCYKCSKFAHFGRPCSRDHSIDLSSLGIRQCPICGMGVQKNGGCNELKCKACRKRFCYLCGQLVTPGHYGNGPGQCPSGHTHGETVCLNVCLCLSLTILLPFTLVLCLGYCVLKRSSKRKREKRRARLAANGGGLL